MLLVILTVKKLLERNRIGVDTSNLAAKSSLANLKSTVDKLI